MQDSNEITCRGCDHTFSSDESAIEYADEDSSVIKRKKCPECHITHTEIHNISEEDNQLLTASLNNMDKEVTDSVTSASKLSNLLVEQWSSFSEETRKSMVRDISELLVREEQ